MSLPLFQEIRQLVHLMHSSVDVPLVMAGFETLNSGLHRAVALIYVVPDDPAAPRRDGTHRNAIAHDRQHPIETSSPPPDSRVRTSDTDQRQVCPGRLGRKAADPPRSHAHYMGLKYSQKAELQ